VHEAPGTLRIGLAGGWSAPPMRLRPGPSSAGESWRALTREPLSRASRASNYDHHRDFDSEVLAHHNVTDDGGSNPR
jgi:hypothetical protein